MKKQPATGLFMFRPTTKGVVETRLIDRQRVGGQAAQRLALEIHGMAEVTVEEHVWQTLIQVARRGTSRRRR
jgi:hypothetical protein